ncbi:MAG: hypothetical protein Q4B06_03145 [Candidatus Saccharibacteria bacterium]|nr:hypothetical protein [Candidatus Saccharibacteria bacterium]
MYDTGNEYRQFSYEPAAASYEGYYNDNEAPLLHTFEQSAAMPQYEQPLAQELCPESQTVLAIGANLDFYRQQMLEMQESA